MAEVPSGISFKFSKKKVKPTLEKYAPYESFEDSTEYIHSLDDKKIKSTLLPKKDNLVIPLIKKNVWRMPEEKFLESDCLGQQAIVEILQGSNGGPRDEGSTCVVPAIMQNCIPRGFETEEKVDVSLRPDSSTPDDYERVPVDHFGLAMLRGMGWKPGTPIGLRSKNCVEAVDVVVRPKGLGLGAEKRLHSPEEEEELVLKSGSFVCVESGYHKGHYGRVESLDEATGRAIVRTTRGSVSIPELSFRVVTEKEFCAGTQKKKQLSPHEDHPIDRNEESWIRSQLRVRFIDKSYLGGKYYNTKMIVEKLVTPSRCVCRAEDSRLLEDVSAFSLETVVPRDPKHRVMIVRGRKAGQVGTLLDRDRSKCLATVRLHSGKILRCLPYDDVCELVTR